MATGADAYTNFGWETSFASESAAIDKTFGEGVRLSTANKRRTLNRIYGLGSRNAQVLMEGPFEGALTIDFELTADPWFLEAVIGTASTTGTVSPYIHTFSEDNQPKSMTVENGIDLTSDAVIKYLGVVVNEMSITAEVGETPAHCTLTCLYADETKTTSGIGSKVSASEEPFNFGMAHFEVPDDTTISDTERIEFTLTNNAVMGYGLGSTKPAYRSYGEREYSITTVNLFDDASLYLEKLYGDSTQVKDTVTSIADLGILLDRGGTGTETRTIDIILSNAKIESHDIPQSVDEPVMETVELWARSGSIVVKNDSSASA